VQAAAGRLDLTVVPLEIRRAEDIAPAFEALKNRADALYVQGDLLTIANRIAINTWVLGARLPTTYAFTIRGLLGSVGGGRAWWWR